LHVRLLTLFSPTILLVRSTDKEHHYDMQVVRTIVQQAVPRPELKFFTMETVCGAGEKSLEEVSEGEELKK
jgi:hypothetical protein